MFGLLVTPAVLSALVLAAHFMRRGQILLCLVCLAAAVLAFVRRRWAPRVVQVFLLLAVAEWARTLVALLHERRASGEPAGRLVVILGTVMAVALFGAVLLGTRRVLDRARSGAVREAA